MAQGQNLDFAEKKAQLDRLAGDLEDAVASIKSSAWTYKNRKTMVVSGVEVRSNMPSIGADALFPQA